ncbi:hypothetical protein [Palleronia pelagia]|uniref:Flagellar protein FliL n=1 Tax=Palleronia pelagia TaxID=387096 RepID=A0A1H8F4B4_9RHOB|nr:hypothetical protein [Palleronia pelagia]SEN26460.1 hypothetical protein SAMN04488011_103206 [Palleronia pelagia]
MKLTIVILGVLGLSLVGAGYGAATVLAPPPAEMESHTPEADETHATETPKEEAHGPEPVASKDSYEVAQDRLLVRIGQVNVPVQKTRIVSYVVADIALKAVDARAADILTRVESAVRARDVILAEMHALAERPILRGVNIDDRALGTALTEALKPEFPGVEDVVFVNLLKQDVPRM